MDKIKFATLIAYIQKLIKLDMQLSYYEIKEIDKMINEGPQAGLISSEKLDFLMGSIRNTNKIEAIKAYRAMTGQGLKESKDAVEKYGFGVDN